MTVDSPAKSTSTLYLDLPETWDQVPAEVDDYAVWVRDGFEGLEVSEEDRHALESAFRAMLVEARGEGLAFMASYVGYIQSEEHDTPELLVATAFGAAKPSGNLAGVLSPFAWHTALRDAEHHGDIKPLKLPETVMLGEIEAVKSVVIDTLPADEHGPAVDNLTVTYYAGINDGATVLIIGFRTPCLWMADEFEELFDRIAETVRIESDGTDAAPQDGSSDPADTGEDDPST